MALSKRYRITIKTVAKWRKRGSVKDLPTKIKNPHSAVLSIEEKVMSVVFRKHTLIYIAASG